MVKAAMLDPSYIEVENWKILEEKTFHYYSEEETPFNAVLVEIGTLTTFKPTVFGNMVEKTPITRWITRTEYEALLRNSGVVIF